MNPDAAGLWRAPAWALAFPLALLSMLAPFAVDTYLPAFSGVAQSLHASPVQMQQTLSSHLFGYALMNLLRGPCQTASGESRFSWLVPLCSPQPRWAAP
jgi:DHA1 family bicyclomycin/chloramphenicol resistance-like MFS transporter